MNNVLQNIHSQVNMPFNSVHENLVGSEYPPEQDPGTFVGDGWYDYLTEDGRMYFGFAFFPQLLENGEKYYEIDIIYMPRYNLFTDRNDDINITHRLNSPRGGDLVCVDEGYEPQTLQQAMGIARVWAEKTWQYILTGETFQDA